LSTVTTTESECASYEFTTLTCIPGVIEYKGANIQLLDLPGIIEGASQGKGLFNKLIMIIIPKHTHTLCINDDSYPCSLNCPFIGQWWKKNIGPLFCVENGLRYKIETNKC